MTKFIKAMLIEDLDTYKAVTLEDKTTGKTNEFITSASASGIYLDPVFTNKHIVTISEVILDKVYNTTVDTMRYESLFTINNLGLLVMESYDSREEASIIYEFFLRLSTATSDYVESEELPEATGILN